MVRGADPHRAPRLRERLYAEPYYRVVYGESDGLPGLVVDRYGSQCVVQLGTAGMEELKPFIQEAVLQVLKCDALLFKNDSGARELEGLPSYVEVARGKFDGPGLAIEDGLKFSVPLAEGQKTGWFFDQAANRRALTKYVRKGARVLDVFSYVGAWGIRAAKCGAADVLCVDSSAAALELAEKNAGDNRTRIATRKGDSFDVLEALIKEKARFDVVVVDPPAFAKRRKDLPKALAAYKRLNQLAHAGAGRRRHPGLLFLLASRQRRGFAGRHRQGGTRHGADKHLQILQFGGQAPDHPVHPAIPETRYLKAYFCRVNDGLK